jgi:hypothetical protein
MAFAIIGRVTTDIASTVLTATTGMMARKGEQSENKMQLS